jgi:hypothetical protein
LFSVKFNPDIPRKFMSKRVFQIVLLALIAVCLSSATQAQSQPVSASKKSSASATCDGALDIVPTKSMSFARKRRPNSGGKGDAKPQAAPAANAKTQPKPLNN